MKVETYNLSFFWSFTRCLFLQPDEKEEASEGDFKYAAPELLLDVFTSKADVFSIGITILELAGNLDLPNGGELWRALREKRIPRDKLKSTFFKS